MKSGLLGRQGGTSVSVDSGDGRGLGLVGGEDIKRWYSPSREGPKFKKRESLKGAGAGSGVRGWGFGTC